MQTLLCFPLAMGPHSLQLIETVGLIHPLYSTLMFLPKKPRPFRSAFSFVPTNIRALRCSIRHPLQCTLSDCPSLAIATVPSTFDSGGASMTFTKASGSFRLMKMSAYARSRESSSRSSSVSAHQFHFSTPLRQCYVRRCISGLSPCSNTSLQLLWNAYQALLSNPLACHTRNIRH